MSDSETVTFVENPSWFDEFQLEAEPNLFLLKQAGGLKAATIRNEPVRTGEVQALQAQYSGASPGSLGEARFYPRAIWSILEFGTVNNPPYRPITRGADQIGLNLEWNG